jgi:ribosomal protein L11 methyltransferase
MNSRENAGLAVQIRNHLAAMDPAAVWRPVIGPDGEVLAKGSGPAPDDLAGYVSGVSFAGKSVLDLGANLGFYSFLAAKGGAKSVLGLDSDPVTVTGAELLAKLHDHDNAAFSVRDFLRDPPEDRFDLVLVIDFIGRGVVAKGRLDAVLDCAAKCACREIFLTFHPSYALSELDPDGSGLPQAYAPFIRSGRFHLEEYVEARLRPEFIPRRIHEGRVGEYALKAAILYERS